VWGSWTWSRGRPSAVEPAEAIATCSSHDARPNVGWIHNPRSAPDRHSTLEPSYVAEMATNVLDDPPSDVQQTSTSPREMLWASPSSLTIEFVKQVSTPLETPLIKATPLRQKRRSPSSASIRRSICLATKCGSHASNATLQVQKVLTAKWNPTPQP
jgi:hypothetical protein